MSDRGEIYFEKAWSPSGILAKRLDSPRMLSLQVHASTLYSVSGFCLLCSSALLGSMRHVSTS